MPHKIKDAATLQAMLDASTPIQIAQICATLAQSFEKEAPVYQVLLIHLSDLITRQELMLEQAKLLPRQDFTGRTH